MENKFSKRIKLLIAAVLVLFLAMAVMDFVPSGLKGFREGYEAGRADAKAAWQRSNRHMSAIIEPTTSDDSPWSFANGVEFQTVEAFGEMVVPDNNDAGTLWVEVVRSVLAFLAVGAMLTFMICLVIFAIKFPRRRIMAHQNIVSLRWIAGSLGVAGLASYGFQFIEFMWLRVHVVLDGYRLRLDSPPSGLIVALILLAMTEILNLAGKLQNEQDLTI
jgi:hypothetical protein